MAFCSVVFARQSRMQCACCTKEIFAFENHIILKYAPRAFCSISIRGIEILVSFASLGLSWVLLPFFICYCPSILTARVFSLYFSHPYVFYICICAISTVNGIRCSCNLIFRRIQIQISYGFHKRRFTCSSISLTYPHTFAFHKTIVASY